MEPTIDPAVAAGMGIFAMIVWLVTIVITIVVSCKIFSKAGYSWALGLLMLIPIVNFIMMLVLAFSEWPIQKEIKALKAQPAPATE